MALDTCNTHTGVKANGRCQACLKPLCPRCQTFNGCCSERCGRATAKFAKDRVPELHKPNPLWPILQVLIILGLIYAAAKYMGYIK